MADVKLLPRLLPPVVLVIEFLPQLSVFRFQFSVFFSIRSFQVASSSDDAAGSCNGIGNGVVVDERRLWQHRNVIVDVLQFPPAEAEYRREQAFVIDKWQPAGATT